MAEVHIVDIDGEQWDIKDLPLTQRVANLETTLPTKLENIFNGDIDNSKFSIPSNGSPKTADYTGLLYGTIAKTQNNSSTVMITENGNRVVATDMCTAASAYTPFTILIRKDKVYAFDKSSDASAQIINQQFIPFVFN